MKSFLLALGLAVSVSAQDKPPVLVHAVGRTEPVGTDADDPAIWIDKSDPGKSLILATDKTEAPNGALVVFDLSGRSVRRIGPLDRPNNVDVEYGFRLGGRVVDLAVVTERKKNRLRIFAIDRKSRELRDVTGRARVFEGESGDASEPMGIGLYRSPRGAIHAFVSPKSGPRKGYMGHYALVANGSKVDARLVRRFGEFCGEGEIESVLVDDEMGIVYYSDEAAGIRKYAVDPKNGNELGFFGRQGYVGDREGLAIYATGPRRGFLFSTDQIEGGTITKVYRREGKNTFVANLAGGADDTDGIEVSSMSLGPGFANGIWIAMNSGEKNFLLYSGASIRKALGLR